MVDDKNFSYEKWIKGSYPFPAKPGLDRMAKVLELLGNPHKKLKYVHIAGTNGKGSTSSYINNVLIEAGYKTGLYTSPGIHSINDRIKINNEIITDEEASSIAARLKSAADQLIEAGMDGLTQFEILTCIAFMFFEFNKCDVVVLETGLGGRLDATNIIDCPEVAVITTISYDHVKILGNTLAEIAEEKAAIIKKGCIAVCYDHEEEIAQVFRERCRETQAEYRKTEFSKINILDYNIEGQNFCYKGIENIYTPMLGEHQVKNAAVAIEACHALMDRGFNLKTEHILRGIGKTSYEGRMEILKRNPLIIFDGAHNQEGVNTLVHNLNLYFNNRKIIFVVGMLEDKDVEYAIKRTLPLAERYIAIAPDNPRAVPPARLARLINQYYNDVSYSDTIEEGIKKALSEVRPKDMICIFGSLYLIDDVKNVLEGDTFDKFKR